MTGCLMKRWQRTKVCWSLGVWHLDRFPCLLDKVTLAPLARTSLHCLWPCTACLLVRVMCLKRTWRRHKRIPCCWTRLFWLRCCVSFSAVCELCSRMSSWSRWCVNAPWGIHTKEISLLLDKVTLASLTRTFLHCFWACERMSSWSKDVFEPHIETYTQETNSLLLDKVTLALLTWTSLCCLWTCRRMSSWSKWCVWDAHWDIQATQNSLLLDKVSLVVDSYLSLPVDNACLHVKMMCLTRTLRQTCQTK